jgi:hypothetical protein
MLKLINPRFVTFPRSAYATFCRTFITLLAAAGPFLRDTVGASKIAAFQAFVARLDALMLWPGMKVITALIAEGNRALDHSLSALGGQLRQIFRYGTDSALVAAANRILEMLKHYGNVAIKEYYAEVGDIKSILANLNGPYAADVTLLGIGALKDNLQAAYDNFVALLAERKAIEDARPKDPDGNADTFEKLRKVIEPLFRTIASVINGGLAMGISLEFPAFVRLVNPEIAHINFANRKVRYDIALSEPARIADQPWTGVEVTPVPEVLFVKEEGTEWLRLGRHFDVSYKNNIDVGNAYCFIHGKGDYRGVKEVSFIIRRGINAADLEDEPKANERLASNNEQSKDVKRKPTAKGEWVQAAIAEALTHDVIAPDAAEAKADGPNAAALPANEGAPVAETPAAPAPAPPVNDGGVAANEE